MISSELDILETTLRDGNYVVDFQFTARDTGWLAGKLEACGMNYIEIGHGLGIGASQVHATAAASDASARARSTRSRQQPISDSISFESVPISSGSNRCRPS